MAQQKITPFLWFDDQAEEAAEFYTSVFPDGRVLGSTRYSDSGPGKPGSVMTVTFEAAGITFTALNGGPHHTFSPAVSFVVDCADQVEVDRYWAALTADGGQEGPCGWLTDRYGLSWQIVPHELRTLVADPDPGRAQRATQAMLGMKKIDIGAMRAAADAG
ncbi:VOC family protein [Phaeacidiphilus oryzae]|uniref:VOC family protein n=1 Tax=Phaeacidiphilus oryzae TaxID=348818 RepID=UPI00056BE40D|nr:VOC family protein [Phaeacidiphilus oryzae]